MEYEAWMLALIEQFVVSNGRNIREIEQLLKFDFSEDPETTYNPYHWFKRYLEPAELIITNTKSKHCHSYLIFLLTTTRI